MWRQDIFYFLVLYHISISQLIADVTLWSFRAALILSRASFLLLRLWLRLSSSFFPFRTTFSSSGPFLRLPPSSRAGHTSRAPAVSAGPGQVHRGKREAGKEEKGEEEEGRSGKGITQAANLNAFYIALFMQAPSLPPSPSISLAREHE